MREIKFRLILDGEIIGHEKQGGDGYGSIFHSTDGINWPCITDDDGFYFISHDNKEQFTGLHDKNGKEIYEGDVRRGGYVVKYLPNKASFMWTSQKTKDTVFIRSICSEDEIIGNIHENPELLEASC